MSKAYTRITVPISLRDTCMTIKESALEVPNTTEGHAFLDWWKTASVIDRESVTRRAMAHDTTFVAARQAIENDWRSAD